ncbi:MAG: tRNA pseudouridine(55) synthase TruB [Gemmatimonadota bacterium]
MAETTAGLLLADKPAGPTSHDVVAAVRRALGGARVGHAGTLDPFATGLLLLLLGRATRLAEYASGLEKTYLATLRLNASSTTDDPDGRITEGPPADPPDEETLRTALAGFVGETLQAPPRFSALRVAGERAYRMARRDVDFALEPRPVRVHDVELLAYEFPCASFRARTGPGVYVRSLARDVGRALGTAAYLTALRREAIGTFRVEAAIDVRRLEGDRIAAALRPAEEAVAHLTSVALDPGDARAFAAGRRLPAVARMAVTSGGGVDPREAGPPGPEAVVRVLGPEGFLGIGIVEDEILRPVKVLFPERAEP